ncbi:MAG: TlpA disulfide reductase family protein [Edaphocola sp.]
MYIGRKSRHTVGIKILVAIGLMIYLRGWTDFVTLAESCTIGLVLFFALQVSMSRGHCVAIKKNIFFKSLVCYFSVLMFSIIVDWEWPSIGIPNILFEILGIVCGFFFSVSVKKIIPILSIVCLIFFSISYTLFFSKYWYNKVFYGAFSGLQRQEKQISLPILKGGKRIKIVDVWNTSCVVCFRKFPQFQAIYSKYKNDNRLDVVSINIPLKRDTIGMAEYMIKQRGYTFPVIIGDSTVLNQLDIEYYPTTLLLKGDSILFRGDVDAMENVLQDFLN